MAWVADISFPQSTRSVILDDHRFTQMAGRAGRRGKDKQGDVFLLVRDLPSVSVIMNITEKTTDQVKSRFRISYAMILNIIRVQDLTLESMLSHSFLEAVRLRELDQKQYGKVFVKSRCYG